MSIKKSISVYLFIDKIPINCDELSSTQINNYKTKY